jgi:hypothetical protein
MEPLQEPVRRFMRAGVLDAADLKPRFLVDVRDLVRQRTARDIRC